MSKPGWSRTDSSGPMTGKPLRLYPLASHSSSVGRPVRRQQPQAPVDAQRALTPVLGGELRILGEAQDVRVRVDLHQERIFSSVRRNPALASARICGSSMVSSSRPRMTIWPSTIVVSTALPLAENTRWE